MATAAKEEKVNTSQLKVKFFTLFEFSKFSDEIAKFSKSQDPTNSKKDDSKANASPTDSGTAPPYRSLLEGNGFKVVKKIGSGSYSKVKVVEKIENFHLNSLKNVISYIHSLRSPNNTNQW